MESKKNREKKQQKGFSLVELMVVIGIIGILTALALPRYGIYRAKARQAEAKNNLSHIFTLEEAYNADNSSYSTMGTIGRTSTNCPSPQVNNIGFSLTPCTKSSYEYVVTSTDLSLNFTATASSGDTTDNLVRKGCSKDIWTINEQMLFSATNDVTKTCDK